MSTATLYTSLGTLGTIGTLLGIFIFLIIMAEKRNESSMKERERITDRFLQTMERIASASAEGPIKLAIELHSLGAKVDELIKVIEALQRFSSQEHGEMMQTIREWNLSTYVEPADDGRKVGA